MNSRRWTGASMVLLLAAAAAAGMLVGCSGGEEEQESAINRIPLKQAVVIVDGTEISGAWLRNWCVTQILQLKRRGLPAEVDEYSLIKAGRELLTKIVVVALEAERRGLTVDEATIQEKMAEEMSRFPSTEAWLDSLRGSGLTREQRKEQIRLESLFFRYQEEIVAPEAEAQAASPEMVRGYYDKFREDLFKMPRQVELFHLMRSVARDAPEEERLREKQAIQAARARIEAGESFEDVARELSSDSTALKGGEVGWVDENAPMLPELKDAVLALENGELSGVLESPHGYHLFWAREVKPSGIQSFDEVKEQIHDRLLKEGLKEQMERHVTGLMQQLQAEGKIKVLSSTTYLDRALTPKEEQQGEAAPAQGE